jgi:hypothetical protein
VITITLPRLIGTRDAATRLLDEFGVGSTLTGERVEVNARNLSSSTTSFTDELLVELTERGADEIIVASAPTEFIKQVDHVISVHGFGNVRTATHA